MTPLLSIVILCFIHVYGSNPRLTQSFFHSKFLSIGGGIAIAYVFVDLLPKLSESDYLVRRFLAGFFPYFERHVYILALCGFMLFFLVDRSKNFVWTNASYWLSLISYTLFNFFMGYAIGFQNDPDIQPLLLFTIAMGLHFFTNDYTLNRENPGFHQGIGRWVLVAALFGGWIVSQNWVISPAAIALVNAFIAGGVIMNVTRHELPSDNPNSTLSFIIGAAIYSLVILKPEWLYRVLTSM